MRKNSQTANLVLEILEKAVDGYVRMEDFLYNTHIYAKGYDRPLKKSSLSQTLRRLRLKGYIDASHHQNQIIYKLTESGKKQRDIFNLLSDETWDGKWRILVFDIPESHRKARNVLRSRLKLWKFKALQKSVWVTKKPLMQQVREFIDEVGISKWVIIFETSDLGKLHFSNDRQ